MGTYIKNMKSIHLLITLFLYIGTLNSIKLKFLPKGSDTVLKVIGKDGRTSFAQERAFAAQLKRDEAKEAAMAKKKAAALEKKKKSREEKKAAAAPAKKDEKKEEKAEE